MGLVRSKLCPGQEYAPAQAAVVTVHVGGWGTIVIGRDGVSAVVVVVLDARIPRSLLIGIPQTKDIAKHTR